MGVETVAPTGIQSLDRRSCSKSLYRLSYPGPLSVRNFAVYFVWCQMTSAVTSQSTICMRLVFCGSMLSFVVVCCNVCQFPSDNCFVSRPLCVPTDRLSYLLLGFEQNSCNSVVVLVRGRCFLGLSIHRGEADAFRLLRSSPYRSSGRPGESLWCFVFIKSVVIRNDFDTSHPIVLYNNGIF
jgi:hypothetical protein